MSSSRGTSNGGNHLFKEVGKLSQMGRFQPAIDLIKDTWKDTDDSWIYVLDRDADGNENVFQDFTAAGTETMSDNSTSGY